jgi:hypothetical protein
MLNLNPIARTGSTIDHVRRKVKFKTLCPFGSDFFPERLVVVLCSLIGITVGAGQAAISN